MKSGLRSKDDDDDDELKMIFKAKAVLLSQKNQDNLFILVNRFLFLPDFSLGCLVFRLFIKTKTCILFTVSSIYYATAFAIPITYWHFL